MFSPMVLLRLCTNSRNCTIMSFIIADTFSAPVCFQILLLLYSLSSLLIFKTFTNYVLIILFIILFVLSLVAFPPSMLVLYLIVSELLTKSSNISLCVLTLLSSRVSAPLFLVL